MSLKQGGDPPGNTAYDLLLKLGRWLCRNWLPVSSVIAVLVFACIGARVAWPSASCRAYKAWGIPNDFLLCSAEPGSTGTLRIAYFYVDPSLGGSASQDGQVQKNGFDAAVTEFTETTGRREIDSFAFSYVTGLKNAHVAVLTEMQRLYTERGTRVFVVTMSQIVAPMRELFKQWRNQIVDADQRPILVVTVASSAGLAESDVGIVRLYVRATEEVNELAKYAVWRLSATRAGVFFIDDRYGQNWSEQLSQELPRMGGPVVVGFGIGGEDKADAIRTRVKDWTSQNGTEQAVAFVVGYGEMLKRTIEALRAEGYTGPILSTSTITHVKWQPVPQAVPDSILTVVPRRTKPQLGPSPDDDVVHFFSRMALRKALECADNTTDTADFVRKWASSGVCDLSVKDSGLLVDYLANGDAIIGLEVRSPWPSRKL